MRRSEAGGCAEARRCPTCWSPIPPPCWRPCCPGSWRPSSLRCLLESSASEHGARMSAMDKASSNAAEMIDRLTLTHEQDPPGQHHQPDHRDRLRRQRLTARSPPFARPSARPFLSSRFPMSNNHQGRVIAIVGPAVDVEFDNHLPEIMNALLTDIVDAQGHTSTVTLEVQQHLGENRVRCVAMQPTDGMVRGQMVVGHRRAHPGARGPRDPGPHHQRGGRARGRARPRRPQDDPAHPPRGPQVRGAEHLLRDVRDGHQGHRPAGALRQGRQDGPLRRRRRGQDRAHHGAHQQHRQGPRRLSVFAGRGRAHPRGQRPLARDDGFRRHRQGRPAEVQGGPDLRPDDRAPRSPRPGGPHRPHRRRVLPRRRRQGRAALHRQHLPLHPGRLRGVRAAGPHALRRGLPAHPGHGDGRAAGAHHLHQEGLHHLRAGGLRARGRLHRPRARHHLRPPGRHHEPQPRARGPGHLPGRGSPGLHQPPAGSPRPGRASTTTPPCA